MSKGKGKDTLIGSHVSLRQCKLAIDALHAYSLKKEQKVAETELLPGKEQYVWLQVAVKKMQPIKKLKPFKIPIVHPLVDPRISAVCLITKDPQREYKDLLESHGIKFISRVIGITKLKGKFKPFEARRMLLKENGMFLADERIIPLLPGLLGSKWFEAKKQPIPVCLTRKDLKGELERAISSTYMHQNQGTCTSIKIATTAQSPAQALANLEKALPAVVANLKGGWENVQSLHLKTNESVALPIWTCELGLEGTESRWNGLVARDGDDSDGDDDEMDVDDIDTAPSDSIPAATSTTATDLSVEKKKRLKKEQGALAAAAAAINGDVDVVPSDSTAIAVRDGQKKKKKAKSLAGEESNAAATESIVIDTPALAEDTSTKLSRKDKKRARVNRTNPSADAEPSAPVSSGITKEELKQKRSGESGERKKDRAIKKSGKSAKDAILGRKAGQS